MTSTGQATRLDTQVDIPVEIGLPHFINDNRTDDDPLMYRNFKLSLQSVVCHRGNSVNSGHYISLVRGTSVPGLEEGQHQNNTPMESPTHWMRFDDLANEKITLTDINEALRQETPYLLFYQILPIEGDPGHITDGEIHSSMTSDGLTSVEGLSTIDHTAISRDGTSEQLSSRRTITEHPRGRSPGMNLTRSTLTFSEPENIPESTEDLQQRKQSAREERKSFSLFKLTPQSSKEKILTETANGSVTLAPPPSTTLPTEIAVTELPASEVREPGNREGKAALRKDRRRSKSRSRLRGRFQGSNGGFGEGGKPDRECIVM